MLRGASKRASFCLMDTSEGRAAQVNADKYSAKLRREEYVCGYGDGRRGESYRGKGAAYRDGYDAGKKLREKYFKALEDHVASRKPA